MNIADRLIKLAGLGRSREKKAGRGWKKEKGDWGEGEATDWMKKNGYEILERNYLRKGGEIDIIARKDGMLLFVEVKTRSGGSFGSPVEAVDRRKMKRIMVAARVYLMRFAGREPVCRFDVVEVIPNDAGKVAINHIPDAFRPGWEDS